MFAWNLLLAIAWVVLLGEATLRSFASGFILGYLLLWLLPHARGGSAYFRRVITFIRFAGFYVWKLVLANLRVAYDVITPHYFMRPGIVAIPLSASTDLEITVLAAVIGLTPGTVALDVSRDRRILYLHAMYIDDPDELRREVKHDYERRVMELLR
ncbi:MAG: Na+/H+ antiporter subunit E [Armatimonadota bacterium]